MDETAASTMKLVAVSACANRRGEGRGQAASNLWMSAGGADGGRQEIIARGRPGRVMVGVGLAITMPSAIGLLVTVLRRRTH